MSVIEFTNNEATVLLNAFASVQNPLEDLYYVSLTRLNRAIKEKKKNNIDNIFVELSGKLLRAIKEEYQQASENNVAFDWKMYADILQQTTNVLEKPWDGQVAGDYQTLVHKVEQYNASQKIKGIMQRILGILMLGFTFVGIPILASVLATFAPPALGALLIVGGAFGVGPACVYGGGSLAKNGATLFANANRFKEKVLTPMQQIANMSKESTPGDGNRCPSNNRKGM